MPMKEHYHDNALCRRVKSEGVAGSSPSWYIQNLWTTESFTTHLSLHVPVLVGLIVLGVDTQVL